MLFYVELVAVFLPPFLSNLLSLLLEGFFWLAQVESVAFDYLPLDLFLLPIMVYYSLAISAKKGWLSAYSAVMRF